MFMQEHVNRRLFFFYLFLENYSCEAAKLLSVQYWTFKIPWGSNCVLSYFYFLSCLSLSLHWFSIKVFFNENKVQNKIKCYYYTGQTRHASYNFMAFSTLYFNAVHVSSFTAEPLPLMDLCRRVARLALGRERIHHIDTLPLPQTLKNYLQYQWPHTDEDKPRPICSSGIQPLKNCSTAHLLRMWTKTTSRWRRPQSKGVFVFTTGGVYPFWMLLFIWFLASFFFLFVWFCCCWLLSFLDWLL